MTDPRITNSLNALKVALERLLDGTDEAEAAWADYLLNHVHAIEKALAGQPTMRPVPTLQISMTSVLKILSPHRKS